MNEKIIIGTGILIGILLLKKTKPVFVKGILIGLGISYSLTLFNIQLLTNLGFYGFGILSLAYSIFCVVKKVGYTLQSLFFRLYYSFSIFLCGITKMN